MMDYNSEKSYVNWLYHVPGFGRKKMKEMLKHGITAQELYQMTGSEWRDYLYEKCNFTRKQADAAVGQILKLKNEKTSEYLVDELNKKKISFLLPGDPGYPKKLEEIPDAPYALYMKGNDEAVRRIEKKSVAIIGARECSQYGRGVAQHLGKRCAELGLAVVSGMAYGVDGISQSAAMAEGGIVAAVLGSGVDVCYPYSNRKLYEDLCLRGCVYSEYIPETEPKPANFPPRNRIISGMADALIVVEAKEKSGTLITVDMALEQGKEVYVIPGRVSDPMSTGCNRLVRQGASIVCDIDETLMEIASSDLHNIKEVCPAAASPALGNPYPNGSLRHRIYMALDLQPKSVQQIYETLVLDATEGESPTVMKLQTELFYMQMEGVIWENGGRFGVF